MSKTELLNAKVLIMAGGTGGHVFPALALAKELQQRGCQIEWLGTERGIESELVVSAGIKLNCISIQGVRGKSIFSLILAPAKIAASIWQSLKIINRFSPDVVVGLGGYASGPGGVASWIKKIPLVIHEQNARAGTTNKQLVRFAKRILSGLPTNLPGVQCIGNPVRQDILNLASPKIRLADRRGKLRLLILGGSLGALAINELVPKALANIENAQSEIDVIHQCGKKHLDATTQAYIDAGFKAQVQAFISEMADALAWADLVICRSGALTVSELAAAGLGAILIPFPYAIDDHQTFNARWLEQAKAAIIKQQKDLSAEALQRIIEGYLVNRQSLVEMAMAARNLAKPKATQEFANICLEVAHG